MNLDLESIYKQGGFSGKPVHREITFTVDGNEVTGSVWIRKMSYQTAVGDVSHKDEVAASRIANCVVNENGNPLYQVSDVTGFYADGKPVLDANGDPRGGFIESLFWALWSAIVEVNGLGKNQSLDQRTSSGTS